MKIVTDFLEENAKKYADKKAFIDEKNEITFSQLREKSKKIGTVLAKIGCFQTPVCIFMDKNVDCVVSMLGVIYSGNFYTVLDVNMPEARMHKILSVLNPAAVVTTNAYNEKIVAVLRESGVAVRKENIFNIEDCALFEINQPALDESRGKIDETATMFVLFTSGSTGIPKGVIIKHKAFPAYLAWYRDTLKYDDTTIIANQAPFYFIMSCPDIYLTIMCGATCYIPPKKVFSFPMVTLNYLKEHKVNTIYWVPSVYCQIANLKALPEIHIDGLRMVAFGGEVMPTKQLNMWRREYPDTEFVNLYGPTETTELISYYFVDRDYSDTESLPIGVPVSYIKVMLLDENDNEVPYGEIGELCAVGICIADGYYNMPDKTAEVFVANPTYNDGDDPETKIMYRTGDLARWDETGNLIYMGRKDFQIKHMGNRIELGEIETAASSVIGVERNCCLYDSARSKIVLFYQGTCSEDEVDSGLKALLPEYMIPNRVEKLTVMPYNVNGKIDRVELKKMI